MQIQVKRDRCDDVCCTSIVSVNNAPMMFGLEPPLTRKGPGPVAIPAGVYPVWLRWSDHHGFWVPAVMDVPGRTDIEIHPGDFPKDTLGCLLVGSSRHPDVLFDSQAAWHVLLMHILQRIPKEPVTIAYVNQQDTMGLQEVKT